MGFCLHFGLPSVKASTKAIVIIQDATTALPIYFGNSNSFPRPRIICLLTCSSPKRGVDEIATLSSVARNDEELLRYPSQGEEVHVCNL
jgi:hypothetical protein